MCCRCGKQSAVYRGEMEKLKKQFRRFDKGDLYRLLEWFSAHSIDGEMKKEDFIEAMGFQSNVGLVFERMFEVMDKNKNDSIRVEEYLQYMDVINNGSEEDRLKLGFEMINTSGKSEMNFEDFLVSYQTIALHWAQLLGEKPHFDEKMVRQLFQKIDIRERGSISNEDYVQALTKNTELQNCLNFFSDIQLHFRDRAQGTHMNLDSLHSDLFLIKIVRSFNDIAEKLQNILHHIDEPNFEKEAQERILKFEKHSQELKSNKEFYNKENKNRRATLIVAPLSLGKLQKSIPKPLPHVSPMIRSESILKAQPTTFKKNLESIQEIHRIHEEASLDPYEELKEIPIQIKEEEIVDDGNSSKSISASVSIEEPEYNDFKEQQKSNSITKLLQNIPIARAVINGFSRPGSDMKQAFENQLQVPQKSPDEVIEDDFNSVQSETKMQLSGLKSTIQELYEIWEIAKTQSEAISNHINEITENKKKMEKKQNRQRSDVTKNIPHLPLKKNKVLKSNDAGAGNLVIYSHDDFALVANMMIGIKKAVDSVMDYPDIRDADFKIMSAVVLNFSPSKW